MSLCFSSDLDFGSEARSYIALGPKHRQSKQHTRTPLPQQRGARSSTSAGRRALGRAGHSPRGAAATAQLEQRVKGDRSCVWATAGRGGTHEKPGEERPPQRAPVMRGALWGGLSSPGFSCVPPRTAVAQTQDLCPFTRCSRRAVAAAPLELWPALPSARRPAEVLERAPRCCGVGSAATARLEQRLKGHMFYVWATAVRGGTQEKPGEERPPKRAPVMRGASPENGLYAADSPARAASSPLPARCTPAHAHTLPPSSAPQGL